MSAHSGSLPEPPKTHVVLFPSSSMGHLTPFLRLAALLLAQNHRPLKLTLITTQPSVSLAETRLISRFLSAYPDRVTQTEFHPLPIDPSTVNSTDPFWIRFEAIRRSAHLLTPLLSSLSPPPSALIYDVSLLSPVLPVIESFPYHLPAYVLLPSAARMFSLFASFHNLASSIAQLKDDDPLKIPGISPPIPKSSIPPPLHIPDSLFSHIFIEDGPNLRKLNGVLIYTFEALEAEALEAINGGKLGLKLPPVFAVGPFQPCSFEMGDENQGQQLQPLKWLNNQPDGSVVYASFGSKIALPIEQMRELGDGLVKSGFRFVWVVKEKLLDRDETEDRSLLDDEVAMEGRGRGLVVKSWVDQGEILGHRAVGGFLSHSGWNSVAEAAWHGVRVLAWPQNGDHKVVAEVVETSGLGIWARNWAWGGDKEPVLVKGREIGEKIKELMESEELREKAARIREEAQKAAGVGGGREKIFRRLVEEWKIN